jgi:HEAT repeat protein
VKSPRFRVSLVPLVVTFLLTAAWSGCGPSAADQLLTDLQSPDLARRRAAAQAIVEQPAPDPRLRAALTKALGDVDPEVRRWSCRGLGQFGEAGAIPLLEARLTDESTPVRRAAAFSLIRLDPANKGGQKELQQAMKSGDGGVIVALTDWTPPPTWAAPTLVTLLKDRRAGIRRLAAEALGRVGSDDPEVVPALMSASTDSDDRVRQAVTSALVRLKR